MSPSDARSPARAAGPAGSPAPEVATPGPWERKRVRMSLEIERAGLALLAERGLDAVTVDQVAAAAGISVRTFFRYFRNIPEVLAGVPRREVESICRLVRQRPPDEGLLDAFRAVLEAEEYPPGALDNADLRQQTVELWGVVAGTDPERVSAESHAMTLMTAGFTETVRARLDLDPDDEITAGVLGSALAGVVWFVFLQFVRSGGDGSLAARLEQALESLGTLFAADRVLTAGGRAGA